MRKAFSFCALWSAVLWLLAGVSTSTGTWKELLEKADSLSNQAEYDSASVFAGLALAQAETQFGSSDTIVASILDAVGTYHYHQADYESAEKSWKRALTIRETAFGSEHALVAKSLHNLATLYDDQGRYAESEPLHQRALAIREKVLGAHHQDVAASLVNLGNLYYHQGRYQEAVRLHQRALAIFEKALGPNHPNVASCVLNLADLYYEQGKYREAEPLYKRCLAIAEESFGPEHPYVGISLNNLANLYYEQGNQEECEKLHRRALTIFENTLGPEHPYVGYSMNSLGDLYQREGRFAEAETCFSRAFHINEKTLGSGHPETAYSLNKLADVYLDRERYSEAEPLLKQALDIFRKALGSDHQDVATGLNNLANLRRDQGKYAEADTLYQDALETFEKALGANHPKVARCLESFSLHCRLKGDISKALELSRRAFKIRKRNFRDGSSVMSEKDALGYSQFMRNSASDFLSIFFDLAQKDDRLIYDAADVMFSVKGRASEAAFTRAREILMLDHLGALADSLRLARTALSNLYVEGNQEQDPADFRERLDRASRNKDRLESELARRSDDFRSLQEALDIDAEKVVDILSVLPVTSILVEYMKYDYLPLGSRETVGHYLVCTLNGYGDISMQDLGEARGIDSLVDRYRRHVLTVASTEHLPSIVDLTEYRTISNEIYHRVWKPIENEISREELVFLAPDGGMDMVSFAGLMDDNGKYLVEDITIHYLSSGRDLMQLKEQAQPGKGLFALGDPDYDAAPATRLSLSTVGGADSSAHQSEGSSRNVRAACAALRSITLSPLPGTKREVEQVARSWNAQDGPTTVYYGRSASEEKFKQEAPGNRVIHLATHGYFLEAECQPTTSGRGYDPDAGYAGENPLLLSGLFLAGANLHGEGADEEGAEDGILTAEEVAAMDLDGTDLAVLSACETGLGEVKDGEGVYGLRRAFQMAGARTVISALWPVSDKVTAEMMSRIHQSDGENLAETMREIQLAKIDALRESKQADHPFNWGAFIALGDWR